MECKETQKCIVPFLQDELDDEEAEEFIQHVCECKECMEELTIQYLVTEGLQRLETGSTFDVQKELGEKLQRSVETKRFHKKMKMILFFSGMGIAIILVILAAIFFFD